MISAAVVQSPLRMAENCKKRRGGVREDLPQCGWYGRRDKNVGAAERPVYFVNAITGNGALAV